MPKKEHVIEYVERKVGFVPEIMQLMAELKPDLMDHYMRSDKMIHEDGALPAKIKILMAMVSAASRMCESCVEALMKGALKMGATKEEILETVSVIFVTAGAPSVAICKKALLMLKEEGAGKTKGRG